MYRLVQTGLILDHLSRFVIRPIIKYTKFLTQLIGKWTGSVHLVLLKKNLDHRSRKYKDHGIPFFIRTSTDIWSGHLCSVNDDIRKSE